MNLAMCEVPVHPVEYLPEADLAALPELPMTQGEDGLWYCDGESTQGSTTGAQLLDLPNKTATVGVATFNFDAGTVRVVTSSETDKEIAHSISLKQSGIPAGTYFMSGSDGPISVRIAYKEKGVARYDYILSDRSKTLMDFSEYEDILLQVIVLPGSGKSDTTVYPMLNTGTTALPWEPYTGNKPSPNPDYPQPIVNTYPAGTYKAICGDKTYKVVLDDDLRSVPGVADRVTIDTGRGVMRVEKKVGFKEFDSGIGRGHSINTDPAYASIICGWSGIPNVPIDTRTDKMLMSHFRYMYQTNHYSERNIENVFMGYVDSSAHFIITALTSDFPSPEAFDEWYDNEKEKGTPLVLQYRYDVPVICHAIPPQLITISAGRSAQITGTVNDKMDYLEVRGDSWQLVQEQGKNVVDCTKHVNPNFTAGEGSLTGAHAEATIFNNDWVKKNLKPNTTYYGSMTVTMNENVVGKKLFQYRKTLYLYRPVSNTLPMYASNMMGNVNTYLENGESVNMSGSFTTPDDLTNLKVLIYTDRYTDEDGTGMYYSNVTFSNIMLSEVDAPYEPFQPKMPSPEYQSEIKDVGGKVVSSGWNLFDASKCVIGGISGGDGNDYITETRIRSGYIAVEPNKKYTLSGDLGDVFIYNGSYGYGKDKKCIRAIGGATTFTTDSDMRYIKFSIRKDGDLPFTDAEFEDFKKLKLQLIREGINPPYDRHRGNSITLPTLRSLPDGTRDVLYADTRAKRAWVERRVGVEMFDGSEAWELPTQILDGFSTYRLTTFFKKLHSDFVCSHFPCYKDTFYNIVEIVGNIATSWPNTNQLIIRVSNQIADSQAQTSVEAWKAWLAAKHAAGTPVTVQYALATPVIEELPYSDYLLDTAQYQTDIHFVDCDEHLQPEIVAGCKVLGR